MVGIVTRLTSTVQQGHQFAALIRKEIQIRRSALFKGESFKDDEAQIV